MNKIKFVCGLAALLVSLGFAASVNAVTIGDDYHGLFSGRTYAEAIANCLVHWAPSFCGQFAATSQDNKEVQFKCIAGSDSWHGFYPGYGESEGEASRNARAECVIHWRPELCAVQCGY
jgi:hypothetical protein